MADGSGKAIVQLNTERDRKTGQYYPIIYILHPDGQSTTFRRKAIAVQDARNGPECEEVYGVLVNRDGEQFCDADGNPVVINVPVVLLGAAEDPDAPLTWKEVAERAGVSLSSVKRAVQGGALPVPHKAGKRAVRFASADVRAWVERVRRAGK